MSNPIVGSFAAGFISAILSLLVTVLFNLIAPTEGLPWALWAAAFSAFFSAIASYLAGIKRGEGVPMVEEPTPSERATADSR